MNWNTIVYWSSIIGSITSFIGFALSIYIAFHVKDISRYYLFQVRAPQLRKKIASNVQTISSLLNDYPNNRQYIDTELKKCLANLNNLHKKLKLDEARNVKTIIKNVKTVNSRPVFSTIFNRDPISDEVYLKRVRGIHSHLAALDDVIDNILDDNKWRGD